MARLLVDEFIFQFTYYKKEVLKLLKYNTLPQYLY